MTEAMVLSVKDAADAVHDVATLSALIAIVGSVADTPVTNTLLARLKDLKTSMDAGNVLLSTQSGFVDGIEALISATNTQLAAIAGFVDGLESKSDATNALLTTQASYLDGLETLIGATNAALATLAGYTDGVEGLLAGTLKVDQISSAYGSTGTFTASAAGTPYAAGDVLGGVLTFANVGPSASAIILNSVSLEYDAAAIPSGMTSFRLHLYSVTPPSALADNAAFSLPSGDRAAHLGYVDIPAMQIQTGTLKVDVDNIGKQRKLTSTSLFGYLVTNGAFTGATEAGSAKLHATAV